jgi:hypothetical protein
MFTFSGIAGVLRQVAAGFGIAFGTGAISTSASVWEKAALVLVSGLVFVAEHNNQPTSTVEKTAVKPAPPA